MNMKTKLITLFLAAATVAAAVSACGGARPDKNLPVYLDERKSVEARIDDALARMTLEEKIAMLHAQSQFSSKGVPRLGIPDIQFSYGPHGVGEERSWNGERSAERTDDSCTAFPALTCLAATWDIEMAALYGRSIGREARHRGKDVLLGPGVNIHRTPLAGRNFEYMGEDPFLVSRMVVPYILGVQSQGVAAAVKHFALNNQELDREAVSVGVSERTLHEIYLPAFRAAVTEADAWAVVAAHNRYREQYCSQNEYLLRDILKGEWHFDGVVVSDRGATHDTREAALGGLDIELGTPVRDYDDYFLARPLLRMVENGEIDQRIIDEKVGRILRLVFRTSMNRSRPFGSFASPEHFSASRAIAEGGIVLLKNDREVLPVEASTEGTILVVGENAIRKTATGGGSSGLKTKYEITPLEGLRARFGDRVRYMAGYTSPVDSTLGVEPLAELIEAAGSAAAVIFVGGLDKEPGGDCEGTDRTSLDLPYGQNEIIATLAAANPRTAVVVIGGGGVAMPWKSVVPAIIQGWYLGSEAGNALAAVISGDVNPSGKLPFTYYSSLADCGAHALGNYPGTDQRESYIDDIWVGYRYTDKKGEGATPNFPFGHGLSYTTFEYDQIEGDRDVIAPDGVIKISVRIKNSGSREGSEVVQLYIGDAHASVARPVKELKGFRKVSLRPGKSTKVTFTVGAEELSYFDEARNRTVVEKGNFTAYLASSAGDIRGLVEFSVL